MTQVFLTDETPPRRMIVRGTAAIDHDVLVAEFEDGTRSYRGGKNFWIVKASGLVVGLESVLEPGSFSRQVRAKAIEARRADTPKSGSVEDESAVHESEFAQKPKG